MLEKPLSHEDAINMLTSLAGRQRGGKRERGREGGREGWEVGRGREGGWAVWPDCFPAVGSAAFLHSCVFGQEQE